MGPKLKKLYEQMLSYFSLKGDDEDQIRIHFNVGEEKEGSVVSVDGKTLVLPSKEQLKSYTPEKLVFHPLQESINLGESDVVKMLRHQINIRINISVLAITEGLLMLLASPKQHRELDPEQRELLTSVPGGEDVAVAKRFMQFMTKHFAGSTTRFFTNIYLKKAGTFKGQKHARVGIVQFPIFQLLEETENSKLKASDIETLKALMEFIFPGCTEAESYNHFSDHRDAPWLDCLIKTSANLTSRINDLLVLYKPYIEHADDLKFNLRWLDEMDNIEYYRDELRLIPRQKGNEGSAAVEEPAAAAPAAAVPKVYNAPTNVPIPRHQVQTPTVPAVAAVPVPAARQNGTISFRDIAANNPVVAAQAMNQTALLAGGYSQMQQMQQMQMQQQMAFDPRVGYVAVQPQYHGMMPGMVPGMVPAMVPGYQVAQQVQYVPAGGIAPV